MRPDVDNILFLPREVFPNQQVRNHDQRCKTQNGERLVAPRRGKAMLKINPARMALPQRRFTSSGAFSNRSL
jgi:hypothetical protein